MADFELDVSTLSAAGVTENRQRLKDYGKWVRIRVEQVPKDAILKVLGFTLYFTVAGERRGVSGN